MPASCGKDGSRQRVLRIGTLWIKTLAVSEGSGPLLRLGVDLERLLGLLTTSGISAFSASASETLLNMLTFIHSPC